MTTILSILNRFKNFFFTGRFLGKFAVKWISEIPPHLACVATLPYETLMSVCEFFFKSVNIWQSYKQERDLSRALVHLADTLLKDGESAQNNHVLACNFAKCSPILETFSLTDSAINLS